jgi:insulysin
MEKVHPSSSTRRKLSVHCFSQNPKSGHVSVAAAEALEKELENANVDTSAFAWRTELMAEGEPDIEKFLKYWQNALAKESQAVLGKLITTLHTLRQNYPAGKDVAGAMRHDVTPIKDVQAFKKSLVISERPHPLVDWNDLPTAHL